MKRKIAVIGGGIVGATSAFYLSREPNYEVTLFDEGIGQATRASAGIISPWLSKRRNKEWYQMVKLGAAFYPKFLKDILAEESIPNEIYQQVGTLLFTKKERQLDDLLQIGLKRREDTPEIGELKILTPEKIRELIPIYSKDKKALFAAGGARVDGKELIKLLLNSLEQHHTKLVYERAELQPTKKDKWLISSETYKAEFDVVILANSAWLGDTLAPLGYEVDVRPQKGQLTELATNWETNNWPVVMPAGEKDIIPFLDGKILIGATHEDDGDFDLTLEDSAMKDMVSSAKETFSDAFAYTDIRQGRVGTRAYTSDYAPFFGEIPSLKNVFTASGLGSTGLTAGPIIGKTLSDLVIGKKSVLNPENYPIANYIKAK